MRVDFEQLRDAIAAVFLPRGLAPERAARLASVLAEATFAGYESHGIGRVRGYVEDLESGLLQPGARLQAVRETPATALLDGGMGFGILMGLEAAEVAAAKARQSGVGAVALRACGDVARLAPYAARIAQEGLIGLAMANDAGAGLAVAPHGGTEPILSTNPIAVGIPRAEAPLVFDLATSQIALGAARAASRRGAQVPADTLIGTGGEATTDPGALFEGLAALLPLGGRAFGFKGTALALLVEVLAGGLSGDGLTGDFPDRDGRNALFLLALRPEAFTEKEAFDASVEALLARLRACRPVPGGPPVRVPGERGPRPERIEVMDRLWDGLLALGEG